MSLGWATPPYSALQCDSCFIVSYSRSFSWSSVIGAFMGAAWAAAARQPSASSTDNARIVVAEESFDGAGQSTERAGRLGVSHGREKQQDANTV